MFADFERFPVETEGASINAVSRGEEPAVLLLLGGSPKTLAMWQLGRPSARRIGQTSLR
jgi:hypothetical protein